MPPVKSNMNDPVSEYQQYQDATAEEEHEQKDYDRLAAIEAI